MKFKAVKILVSLAIFVCIFKNVRAQKNRNRRPAVFVPVSSSRERKPNIILILTDDQDVELGSLNFMPKTLRSMRDEGAQFRHAYVTTPMCCPSRSSLLTGMYVHNHNVYTNNDNCSSTQWQATHETRSFATYLSNAGYRTGYFGKYLNKYNGSYIPPGWREWGGLIMNSKYYNYSINMNGKKIKHGFDYYKDYYPDLIANDSIAFLRQSKKNNAHKPVMLTMSFPAPHGPEDSAPQYSHLFFNVTTHHTPSYDYAPNPDKQWILQVTKKMQPIHKAFTNLLMTKRLQTLQSVDSAVQRIIDELEALGELENSYIVYTSDHGYHLGQFGLIKGKSFPFEFDIRVPFLLRGPGVEPGTVVDDIVLNIDLAPTFLDMAGVEAPSHMDGHSVLPLFNSKRKKFKWPDTFLIESSGRRETPFLDAKLRAQKYLEASNTFNYTTVAPVVNSPTVGTPAVVYSTRGPRVYDSGEDFNPEDDVLDDDDELEEDFEEELEDSDNGDEENDDLDDETKTILKGDAFSADNQLLPEMQSKFEKLAEECRKEEYQLPCKFKQVWFCHIEDGRWRKHKCKQPITFPQFAKVFKKCACFTAEGLVYKKLPVNVTLTRRTRTNRFKRDTDLQHILFQRLGEDKMSVRKKRDTLTHVESVMETVQGKLSDLEAVNSSLHRKPPPRTNLDTNRISETMPECIVSPNGKVNCPSIVYEDRKTWRRSRHHIDNEIHHLKEKLEKLKEIRRHLKHAKPLDEDNEYNTTETSDTIGFNHLQVNLAQNYNIYPIPVEYNVTTQRNYNITDYVEAKKRKDNQRIGRRRKLKHDNENTTTESYYGSESYSTHNPISHHRHHHTSTIGTTTIGTTAAPFSTRRRKVTTPKLKLEILSTESPQIEQPQQEYCECEAEEPRRPDPREVAREARRKLKEERLKRKLRKQRKRAQMEKECSSERMNCFQHDNEHWRTAPLWTSGPFCFCMNANNNTYSCVRTINATHNFLYCEFVTGLVTFYNLRIDPFELQNRVDQLRPEERSYLHNQLKTLMSCKGRSCTVTHNTHTGVQKSRSRVIQTHSFLPQPQRYKKRKFAVEEYGNVARSLPLLQSEINTNPDYGYNSHIALIKQWKRRKPWKYVHQKPRDKDRRKQSMNAGSFKRRWT